MKARILTALVISLACLSGCQTETETEIRAETEIAPPQARPVPVRMKPCDGAELKRFVDSVSRQVLQLWSADDAVGFGSKVSAHFRVDRAGAPYGVEVDEASSAEVELAFRAALAGASLPVPPSTRACAVADQRIGLTLPMEPAP